MTEPITRDTRLDELHLWFLGQPEQARLIGTLHLVSAGKGVSLTYAPSWLAQGFPLSEDLPLTAQEHLPRAKDTAAGAVDDARPDRWGERVIQYIDKPRRLSLMEYLYYAGHDRFGALGVSTSSTHYLPRYNGPLPHLDQAQALSGVIAKINAKEAITLQESRMVAAGGSLGGAKPKALIDIDGEQWVIKFFNNEPVDLPRIEHASMTLARLARIHTADTRLVPLAGETAVAVKRFDRLPGQRLHCLSAGTALRAASPDGQSPSLGYPALAQLLRRVGDTQHHEHDMRELFRRMVFNILIDNTDDHEKNHSLLTPAPDRFGTLRLSPAYDVLPTNSGQGHQEFAVGDDGHDATLVNAMSQCELFALTRDQAAQEVQRVIDVVAQWQAHFTACGVSPRDIEQLADR
ncbi:MAG TPA: type II toxin-antitoxin system HipA family toxin, partial [Aquabacterium sp.]|nr:type II toxin-antitoxin system HipA family toxin [Aquabacterium sp.]